MNINIATGEAIIDIRCSFLPQKHVDIAKVLQVCNTQSQLWRQKDFLNALYMQRGTNDIEGLDNLKWVIDRYKTVSENVLWIYLKLNPKEKAPTKTKLCKAVNDDQIFNAIVNPEEFQYGKKLFEKLEKKLNLEVASMIEVAQFFVAGIKAEIDKGLAMDKAVDKYCNFIDSISYKSKTTMCSEKLATTKKGRAIAVVALLEIDLAEYKESLHDSAALTDDSDSEPIGQEKVDVA